MNNKILIALQYWEGDRLQAEKLARFIADIEPAHSESADFLIVARFDSSINREIVKHVSRKFNTYSFHCKRRETGWPAGCNGLWFGTMGWAHDMIEGRKVPHYKAILTFEADCVPLCRDWIARLVREWDSLSGVYVAGALLPDKHAPGGVGHVNGNAMFSGELRFLKWISKDVNSVASRVGWDWILAPDFMRWGWANLRGIRSVWRRPAPMTGLDWDVEINQGTVLFHGIKDDSLMNLAKERLLP